MQTFGQKEDGRDLRLSHTEASLLAIQGASKTSPDENCNFSETAAVSIRNFVSFAVRKKSPLRYLHFGLKQSFPQVLFMLDLWTYPIAFTAILCLRQDKLADGGVTFSTCHCHFVGSLFRLLLNWWTRYFENEWVDFDANWHNWSTGHEAINFGHEVEDRLGALAEASVSTLLGRMGFLVDDMLQPHRIVSICHICVWSLASPFSSFRGGEWGKEGII